jgi:hypothetical protein
VPLKEGDVYTILNQSKLRKENQGFKYFRLVRWDGKIWIIRFIKASDSDWISMTEARLFDMIQNKAIRMSTPIEKLDAIVMEKNK